MRAERWARRKAKHRRDHNHCRGGLVGGNPRYNGRNQHTARDHRPASFRPAPGAELPYVARLT